MDGFFTMVAMGRKLDTAPFQQFRTIVLPGDHGEFRRRTPAPKTRAADPTA